MLDCLTVALWAVTVSAVEWSIVTVSASTEPEGPGPRLAVCCRVVSLLIVRVSSRRPQWNGAFHHPV